MQRQVGPEARDDRQRQDQRRQPCQRRRLVPDRDGQQDQAHGETAPGHQPEGVTGRIAVLLDHSTGTGVEATTSSSTVSSERPRRRAWLVSSSRCPRTGPASALTSSGTTYGRPLIAASAWAAWYRARVALGLAPSRTEVCSRVERTNATT